MIYMGNCILNSRIFHLTFPNFEKIHCLDFTDGSNTEGQSTHFQQQQRSKANQEIRLVTLLYTYVWNSGTILSHQSLVRKR